MSLRLKIYHGLVLALACALQQNAFGQSNMVVVEVRGQIMSSPQRITLSEPSQLADALAEVRVKNDQFPLANAWLRPHAKLEQRDGQHALLKMIRAIKLGQQPKLTDALQNLAQLIGHLPVTGRQHGTRLIRELALVRPEENPRLRHGDALYFPPRLQHLYALNKGELQSIDWVSGLAFSDIASALPQAAWHTPGYLWVVYPDGHVAQVKIGWWAEVSPRLPPGAIIFRPYASNVVAEVQPEFNRILAHWLSYQTVPIKLRPYDPLGRTND